MCYPDRKYGGAIDSPLNVYNVNFGLNTPIGKIPNGRGIELNC